MRAARGSPTGRGPRADQQAGCRTGGAAAREGARGRPAHRQRAEGRSRYNLRRAPGIARDGGQAVPSTAKPGRGRRVRFEMRHSGATRRAGWHGTEDSRFKSPSICCRPVKISLRTDVRVAVWTRRAKFLANGGTLVHPGDSSRSVTGAGMFGDATSDDAAAAPRAAAKRFRAPATMLSGNGSRFVGRGGRKKGGGEAPPDRGGRPRPGAYCRPAALILWATAPAARRPTASRGSSLGPWGRRSGTAKACRNLSRFATNEGFTARRTSTAWRLRPGHSPPGRPRKRSRRTTLAGWWRTRADRRHDFTRHGCAGPPACRLTAGGPPARPPALRKQPLRVPRPPRSSWLSRTPCAPSCAALLRIRSACRSEALWRHRRYGLEKPPAGLPKLVRPNFHTAQ